jgi:hypothetical protein
LIGTSGAFFEQNHVDIGLGILKNMVTGSGPKSRNNERFAHLMAKTAAILCVFLLCLVGVYVGVCAAGDQSYPTNLELLGQAVRQAADSMRIDPPRGLAPLLEVRAGQGSDASWLLESVLKEHLLSVGWRIKADSQSADSSMGAGGYLLRIRIADLGLQYGRSWRRYVFGGKVVERVARVALYYELVNVADDRVEVSSNVGSEVVDVVPASILASLSSPKYTFASPQLEKSQWDRYLEGGLVMAIIGVLVYLFYSNKTAS